MSTGLECEFVETQPDTWYYVLQDGDCPVSAWDWREYATAYGPFTTVEAAQEHLRRNHANPGGWSETRFDPDKPEANLDEVMKKLIKTASNRNFDRLVVYGGGVDRYRPVPRYGPIRRY